MLRNGPPQSEFVSVRAAAYTTQFNKYLLEEILAESRYRSLQHHGDKQQTTAHAEHHPAADSSSSWAQRPEQEPTPAQAWRPHEASGKIAVTAALRGTPHETMKDQEDAPALGGLRDTARSVRSVPGHMLLGPQIVSI